MDPAHLFTRLAEVIDAHDWDTLPSLLHPDFTCRLVHTGEVLDDRAWVRLNAHYPGFQRFVLEDVIASGCRAAARARVTGTDGGGREQVFAVAGFLTVADGLVRELTEVWTEVGQTPDPATRSP